MYCGQNAAEVRGELKNVWGREALRKHLGAAGALEKHRVRVYSRHRINEENDREGDRRAEEY